MKLAVGHIGVVVQDLDRMADFYTRVMGLDETRHVRRKGAFIDGLVGLHNVDLEVRILGTVERPAAIELLKYHRHPSAPVPKGPNGHGVNHLQFVVAELDPIVAALRTEGLEFWGSAQAWPDTWSRVLYAKDPEGNVIELNELPDGGDRSTDPQGERA